MPQKLALLVAVAVLLPACRHASADLPEPASPKISGDTVLFADRVPGITVTPVGSATEGNLTLPGRLNWDEDATVRVFSPFSGRVAQIAAQVGDRVEAGQTLAVLTSPDYGTAQAEARKARASLAFALQTLARARDLLDHGVAAAKDLQQAEADAAAAGAEAERAQQRLKLFGDDGDAVNQRYALKSPIHGTIVERNLNRGQELQTGQAAPLFVVTDPATLWVQLDAREGDLRDIRPGEELRLSTAAYPGQFFAGSIDRIADFVDPATRTVKIRGRVPNRDRRLKAEMFVTAAIGLTGRPQAVLPARAVFLRGSEHFVFVADGNNGFTRRRVEIGPETQGLEPVFEGVHAGDSVVSDGVLYLEQLLNVAGRS